MVAHNANGAAPAINGSLNATPAITIPAVTVTQADGTALKAAVAAGPKTGGIKKNPAHTGIRDGDLENGIIIHEYGHGISSRLTGGVGNSCLGGNEQAGEGWSDYLALTFTMDPTVDNPDVGRGMGPYALFQVDRNGAGIRPRPYSRNMEIQPFTYDSIKTGGWLNGTSLAPARPRPRVGFRAVGPQLGPDRQVRLQPRPSTRRGTRAATTARCST